MGIFSKKHKLPAFPESAAATFRGLCEPLPVDALDEIRADFENCVKSMLAEAGPESRISPKMIEQISDCCRYLFEVYPNHSREQQALIIGAVRYFIVIDDALPDTLYASGLDDDARVINFVLEELGIEDRYIALG
jgi:uncharacterized membrane protein YkvA (DUF1232 family)